MGDLVPHHLISMDVDAFPEAARRHADQLRGRTMLVRKHRAGADRVRGARLPVGLGLEGVSADRAASAASTLPPGLRESDRLPEPIFTPATKAESGHDVNISEEEAGRLVGADLVARLKALTLEIYQPRRRARRVEGDHHRRHQVRIRAGAP